MENAAEKRREERRANAGVDLRITHLHTTLHNRSQRRGTAKAQRLWEVVHARSILALACYCFSGRWIRHWRNNGVLSARAVLLAILHVASNGQRPSFQYEPDGRSSNGKAGAHCLALCGCFGVHTKCGRLANAHSLGCRAAHQEASEHDGERWKFSGRQRSPHSQVQAPALLRDVLSSSPSKHRVDENLLELACKEETCCDRPTERASGLSSTHRRASKAENSVGVEVSQVGDLKRTEGRADDAFRRSYSVSATQQPHDARTMLRQEATYTQRSTQVAKRSVEISCHRI